MAVADERADVQGDTTSVDVSNQTCDTTQRLSPGSGTLPGVPGAAGGAPMLFPAPLFAAGNAAAMTGFSGALAPLDGRQPQAFLPQAFLPPGATPVPLAGKVAGDTAAADAASKVPLALCLPACSCRARARRERAGRALSVPA